MNGPAAYPLTALAQRMGDASGLLPFARPIGSVRSVTATYVAITGLSHRLQLGSLVGIDSPRER